jgi:hypothetical protein
MLWVRVVVFNVGLDALIHAARSPFVASDPHELERRDQLLHYVP